MFNLDGHFLALYKQIEQNTSYVTFSKRMKAFVVWRDQSEAVAFLHVIESMGREGFQKSFDLSHRHSPKILQVK